MAKILIIYSSTDGHTEKICLRLQQIIETQDHYVTVIPVEKNNEISLKSFDKIVIGASIRYGKHNKNIYKFIKENSQVIDSKANAFFSVNVVARKPEKSKPETNPYLRKFLQQISWNPKNLAVFAGRIEYQKYKFVDRFMIRLIMWMTNGPTDPKTNIDFTNWNEVDSFGHTICKI